MDSVKSQLSHLLEEKKSVDKQTRGLRNQLSKSQEKVRVYCETSSKHVIAHSVIVGLHWIT